MFAMCEAAEVTSWIAVVGLQVSGLEEVLQKYECNDRHFFVGDEEDR